MKSEKQVHFKGWAYGSGDLAGHLMSRQIEIKRHRKICLRMSTIHTLWLLKGHSSPAFPKDL